MIQGKNFTVDMENRNLPALYNGGLPAIVNAKKIKKPWFNRKIVSVKWNDFFEVEQNKMKVFKITPHINVSNHHNRHLWAKLHKAYELYHSTNSRTSLKVSNGIKIKHREKDLIWFDIVFKTEGEQKKVEFYFSTSETMAKKFKSILEQRLNITCEEASLVDLEIPEENTIINELRYMKHDIFSLDTNHNTQTTPIGSILNTVNEMENGDFARISICNEREDRKRWFNNAVWASKKVKKGINPQRANISGKRIIDGSKPIVIGFINELGSLVVDTLQAVSNAFTKESKPIEKKPIIEVDKAMDASTMKNKEKVNLSTWKTHVRTAVHSPVKFNRDNISNTIISSFGELSHDNELQAKNIRDTIHIKVGSLEIKVKGRKSEVIRELNTLQMSKKTKFDPNPNIVSSDELGKLVQLPTAELQRKFETSLKTKKNVETDIPAIFRKSGLPIGHSDIKGENIPINLPTNNPDEFYKMYMLIGQQGMGKDGIAQNIVVEGVLNHGISYVVFDQVCEEGNRGMANGITSTLPADKIIDLDLSDEKYSIPFDLSEIVEKLGRSGHDYFADNLIFFFGDVEEKAQTKKILRTFAKACNGSIYTLKRLITDESFRIERIEEIEKEGRLILAEDLRLLGKKQDSLESKAAPILNRIDDFLGNDRLFSMFAQQPKKEMDFSKWMAEGKAIIIRVPERKLSVQTTKTLVSWITFKVFMTRILMDKQQQGNGTVFLYNEPFSYMTPMLSEIISRLAKQGRKERLGCFIALQDFNDVTGQMRASILSGGVNFILFKSENQSLYQELEKTSLQPTFDVVSAMNIEKYHAVAILNFGGRKQPAFMFKALKPCYERLPTYDNSFIQRRHASLFGKSFEEIEKELVQIAR
jgi:hypothetical protein